MCAPQIFECFRKVVLVGIPVALQPGSIDQLTIGLLVCFITFAMYTAYAPFTSHSNDILSMVCQLQIFFTLLSSILRRANPESALMALVMNLFVLMPVTLAICFQFGLLDKLSRCKAYLFGKTTLDDRMVQMVDKMLGTKKLYEEEAVKPSWEDRNRGSTTPFALSSEAQNDLARLFDENQTPKRREEVRTRPRSPIGTARPLPAPRGAEGRQLAKIRPSSNPSSHRDPEAPKASPRVEMPPSTRREAREASPRVETPPSPQQASWTKSSGIVGPQSEALRSFLLVLQAEGASEAGREDGDVNEAAQRQEKADAEAAQQRLQAHLQEARWSADEAIVLGLQAHLQEARRLADEAVVLAARASVQAHARRWADEAVVLAARASDLEDAAVVFSAIDIQARFRSKQARKAVARRLQAAQLSDSCLEA